MTTPNKECPLCPIETRNLFALAHNLVVRVDGGRWDAASESIYDIGRALERVPRPILNTYEDRPCREAISRLYQTLVHVQMLGWDATLDDLRKVVAELQPFMDAHRDCTVPAPEEGTGEAGFDVFMEPPPLKETIIQPRAAQPSVEEGTGEGKGFHWRNGVRFLRGQNGGVSVFVPPEHPFAFTIPANEWCSIVAEVSLSRAYYVAEALHAGTLKSAAQPSVSASVADKRLCQKLKDLAYLLNENRSVDQGKVQLILKAVDRIAALTGETLR
jgi:hypothetical protein